MIKTILTQIKKYHLNIIYTLDLEKTIYLHCFVEVYQKKIARFLKTYIYLEKFKETSPL